MTTKQQKAFLDLIAWSEGTSTSKWTKDRGYDIVVDSGEINLGPVYSVSDSVEIPLIGVYDEAFALGFGSEIVTFAA